MSNPAALNLLKLPELKARCKELGLTGYSKLNKAGLTALLSSPAGTKPAKTSPEVSIKDPVILASTARAPEKQTTTISTPIPASDHKVSLATARTSDRRAEIQPPLPSIQASQLPAQAPAPKLKPSIAGHKPPALKVAQQIPSTDPKPHSSTSAPKHPASSKKRILPPAQPVDHTQRPAQDLSPDIPVLKRAKATAPNLTKAKPPFVRLRTKPIAPIAPNPPTLSVPNRISGESNRALLARHFTVEILRQLNCKTPVMEQQIVDSDEESFTVALRYYISRLHTTVQLGEGGLTKLPSITSCKRLAGDIWSILTSDETTYLCIGPTGEAIHKVQDDTELRADWAAYIRTPTPVLDLVKTKDSHDFPHGIIRSFRGTEERQIAERAVMSSCVLQSFSGQSMALSAMEAEWLGNAAVPVTCQHKVELFLPESHQVLSAHLTPHASVGLVQRVGGYSEYVLRETGQIVGDEDGIALFWQGLLFCDHRGAHDAQAQFWAEVD